jgi:predicted alpha/beta superfamily hydrolase
MKINVAPATWHNYTEVKAADHHTVVGCLKVLDGLYSPQLNNRRDLLVYLPPSYASTGQRRYPIIYMHDGQNLFDEVTSFAGEWHVDTTMEALSADSIEAIVVGIPNAGPKRTEEYSPFLDRRYGRRRLGDAYLRFIIETIKPLIDRDFRTLPDRSHTGLIGSSMGGLISLYAFFQYPDTFGFVGAMSPSLWFANQAMITYIKEAPFYPGRIYADIGSLEYAGAINDGKATGRRTVKPYTGSVRHLCDLLQRKGYQSGVDLLCVEEEGATHQEAAWANRLPNALRFLLA